MASDYLLLIDGIKGESTDAKHPNAIEVHSFRWGATNPSTAGILGPGGGAGKVHFKEVEFTCQVSAASSAIMLHCCSGKHINKAQLFVRKQGGTQHDYYVVTLQSLVVSAFDSIGEEGSTSLPMDQFKLNFARLTFEYRTQKADGLLGPTASHGWDLLANAKL